MISEVFWIHSDSMTLELFPICCVGLSHVQGSSPTFPIPLQHGISAFCTCVGTWEAAQIHVSNIQIPGISQGSLPRNAHGQLRAGPALPALKNQELWIPGVNLIPLLWKTAVGMVPIIAGTERKQK